MVTLTLSSEVGSLPPTKSALPQERVVAERLAPKMDTHVPGAMAAVELPAFNTPLVLMVGSAGGVVTVRVTGMVWAGVVTPLRVSVTVDVYVPGVSPLGSAESVSVAGVNAAVGVMESHLLFAGTIVPTENNTLLPLDLTWIVCGAGAVPPVVAVKVADPGATCRTMPVSETTVRLTPMMACVVPPDVSVTLPE